LYGFSKIKNVGPDNRQDEESGGDVAVVLVVPTVVANFVVELVAVVVVDDVVAAAAVVADKFVEATDVVLGFVTVTLEVGAAVAPVVVDPPKGSQLNLVITEHLALLPAYG